MQEALFDGVGIEGAYLVGAGNCFSGEMIVETLHGPKQMSQLKTGDEVLSMEEGMGMVRILPQLVAHQVF